MRTRDVLIATGCLLAGCALGTVGGRASAQATYRFAPAPRAPRWQQRCERLAEQQWSRDDTPLVAGLGVDGWEIAAMNNFQVCFRRPAE